jgi:hypothetical protein
MREVHPVRGAAGALVLCATLLVAAFSVWLIVGDNSEEHSGRSGGTIMLVLVVPLGVLWSWLLLSRPRR